MDKPKITYHVLESTDTYVPRTNTYIGTYTGDEALSIQFRIWNNFRGTEDVEDLENFMIVARFLTKEDNALLPYISVSVTDVEQLSPILETDAVVFHFAAPVILSGGANTGSDEYIDNYKDITVSFDSGAGVYLKDHDLKSLVIDIVEL